MAKNKTKTNHSDGQTNNQTDSKKDEDVSARSLDVAEEASISVRELNNVILKLKPIVKQAKSRTIQKLVRNIQKLKKTKGSDDKVEKSRNKAERLLDEIYTIKSLELEQLAQYSLGNTTSFFHISAQKDVSVEIKAMTRVSENPKVQEYVKAFRAQHKDWEKLGDFMLFKQSGRRYKHATSENRVERIKASEALVKTYIDKKFSGDKEKIKKVETISEHVLKKHPKKIQDSQVPNLTSSETKSDPKPQKRKLFKSIASQNEDMEEDSSTEEIKPKTKLKSKLKVLNKVLGAKADNDKKESDTDDSENLGNKDSDNEESVNQLKDMKPLKTLNSDDVSDNEDSESEQESDSSDSHVNIAPLKFNKDEDSNSNESGSDDSGINTKNSINIQQQPKKFTNDNLKEQKFENNISEPCKKQKKKKSGEKIENGGKVDEKNEKKREGDDDFVIKKNNEMVVRKIDWDNFGIGSDFRPTLFNKNVPEVKKKKVKNDFFEMSGDEYEEDDEGNDNIVDETKATDPVESKGYGRTLIESAFVKSLGGPPKPKNHLTQKDKRKLEIQVKREVNSKKKLQEKNKIIKLNVKQPDICGHKSHAKDQIQAEKVHPSWAASMKRKQEQSMLSAFQGKKIKFDD